MIFVVLRMTLTPPYLSLCGSRRSGVFVGVKAKVIYLHLVETATIFFVLLPRGYTYMPLCRRSADPIPVILVLLKALCSVSGDADEGEHSSYMLGRGGSVDFPLSQGRVVHIPVDHPKDSPSV